MPPTTGGQPPPMRPATSAIRSNSPFIVRYDKSEKTKYTDAQSGVLATSSAKVSARAWNEQRETCVPLRSIASSSRVRRSSSA